MIEDAAHDAIDQVANSTAAASDGVQASIVYGHTKREVLVGVRSILANDWANCNTREEHLAHVGTQEFLSNLPDVPLVAGPTVVAYRGRRIPCGQPSIDHMGPPPQGTSLPVGRYNTTDKCVLYLCDSGDGVQRELHTGTDPLYIVRFTLPTSSLRIADFTTFAIDHFLTAAFAQAELCEFDLRRGDGYRFSNMLAELVAGSFDGMKVRGVRGAGGEHYSNIVVFRPHPDWRRWIADGEVAYLSPS